MPTLTLLLSLSLSHCSLVSLLTTSANSQESGCSCLRAFALTAASVQESKLPTLVLFESYFKGPLSQWALTWLLNHTLGITFSFPSFALSFLRTCNLLTHNITQLTFLIYQIFLTLCELHKGGASVCIISLEPIMSKVKWKLLSHVQLFATPWTIQSMEIFQARILEWVAVPFSRDLPNPGIKPRSPALQADSLPAESQGKPYNRAYNNAW